MRAIASFILEWGIATSACSFSLALRMRVSMSAIGSDTVTVPPYQLDFFTPGISPL
jgi:hypothetical protein